MAEETRKLTKAQKDIGTVAHMLGMEKIPWSRVVKAYNIAVKDGYTREDFIKAAKAMQAGPKSYWSLISIFTKTDYWLTQSKSDVTTKKGVW